MFRKLRNKIILQNMLVTTAIIVIAFVSIFAFTTAQLKRERPHMPIEFNEESREIRDIFEKEIKRDRDEHIARLALTLIFVGISIESLVFVASYYYAEKAIRPVKDAYEKQREFIANASHELKTPIAAVQANFEALGVDEQPWSNNIETELNRASNLVNDLLTLARTDSRTVSATKKDIDVVKIIRKRAQLIEPRLEKKKIDVDLPEKEVVKINETDFTQVLDILLDNAVKYSKNTIKVSFLGHTLSVENDGKTIPADKLNKIFERFYQTDKTAEGSGLGLAIAKAVSGQNDWKIWAESSKNRTVFSVSF